MPRCKCGRFGNCCQPCVRCKNYFRSNSLPTCDSCSLGSLAFQPGIFPFLDKLETPIASNISSNCGQTLEKTAIRISPKGQP